MNESLPTRLGRYEIQREIGRGMMGVVYRALDPELHRSVALKTVRLSWASSAEERESFERRFLNEARAAASLSHPGIVVVHDVGRDADTGTLFIALEYLEGRTLAELTTGGAALPWREALRLTARVAEALLHAHERGIVHRDVKPANIMLLPSGEPKIMDFGIAKVPAAQLTAAGEFFGTPSYMSPEQAGAGTVDGRSDLFSLGAVLYLLLTGRRAFDAPNVTSILTKLVNEDPEPPSRVVAGLPPDVDDVVARALAKDKADRYPDARALGEDLLDVLEGRPPRHRGRDAAAQAQPNPLADLVGGPPETQDLRRLAAPTLDARAPTLRPGRQARPLLLGAAALALLAAVLVSARRPAGPASGGASGVEGAPPVGAGADAGRPGLLPRLFEKPARLELRFEHSLKAGRLRVFVDDDLALERELSAPIRKKIVIVKKRKEVLEESLELRPGERAIRLQVDSGNDVYGSRIKGSFASGEARRLEASLGGLIGRDLQLRWTAGPASAPEP